MATTRENMLLIIGEAMDSKYGPYYEQLETFENVLPILDNKSADEFNESDWQAIALLFEDILGVVMVGDEGFSSYAQVLAAADGR